jgi:iron complex transport system ATP-binding protein
MNALQMMGIGLRHDGREILSGVDWSVETHERWIVLGLNGSGKTTLVRIASLYLHPSAGRVDVLGERLGRTDVRVLRRRIGVTSAGFADLLRTNVIAEDVVMTAKNAALEPWWHEYSEDDRSRARELLVQMRAGHVAGQAFGTLSSGERQRVLLARTLMTAPSLWLLDEPTAGLDLAGREELVDTLGSLARDPATPPMVLVTHHLEEIPAGFTHALLLRDGHILAKGSLHEVVDDETLSECFGLPLSVRHDGAGRWWARKRGAN